MAIDMKIIPNTNGAYSITDDGRVFSHPKCHGPHGALYKGKFLKDWDNKGYRQVLMKIYGKRKKMLVHRLVGFTYIPNPDNKQLINHIDGNKSNNHVSNLEWCTISENATHGFRKLGRQLTEEQKRWAATLGKKRAKKIMQLTKEGILCRVYDSLKEAHEITKIHNISLGANGIKAMVGGYKWQYLITK